MSAPAIKLPSQVRLPSRVRGEAAAMLAVELDGETPAGAAARSSVILAECLAEGVLARAARVKLNHELRPKAAP